MFYRMRLLFIPVFLLTPLVVLGQTTSHAFLQKQVVQYASDDAQIPARAFNANTAHKPWRHWDKGPVSNLMVVTETKSGITWLRSEQGAARFDPSATHLWDRWQHFSGRAWLPDDHVLDIYIDPATDHESVWIQTSSGVSHISWRPATFEAKAQHYDALTEQFHVRKGFIARSVLTTPGDLGTATNSDTDNDGLWTTMYMAAQAYRFASTGNPDAQNKARRGLEALMKLETIDPIPGFYARTYRTFDEPLPHQDNGEWHPVGDGLTEWKGDTSSDETVGHYYGYALYYDLVANETEKDSIKAYVRRITDYMIDNDYELLDLDGKPTRWGRWSEDYYDSLEGDYEKALRSLELLSFLKTAYHITGDSKYQDAYQERISKGYAHYTLEYRRWGSIEREINFSDDELYYLSIYPLLKYETDPALRAIYLDGLRFTWTQVQPESNALWNFMSAALEAGPLTPELLADARRSLERSPIDLTRHSVKNSHRMDVRLVQSPDRHGRGFLVRVLAPDERRMHKHNGNPYQADAADGGRELMEPTYWLVPYWMGKYYGWL